MATGSNKVRQINSFTKKANKDDIQVKSEGIFTSANRTNEKVDYESVDYNQGSYADTLKNLICEYITDLILDINSVKLEVFIGGVKNETLTEFLTNSILKGTRFYPNLRTAIFQSLKYGKIGNKVEGTVLHPKIYNGDLLYITMDKGSGVLYDFAFQYNRTKGTIPVITTDFYDSKKKNYISQHSAEKKSVKTKADNSTQNKVPIAFCSMVETIDDTLNYGTGIFWNSELDFHEFDAAWRKLQVYLKQYHAHLFPIKELFENKYDIKSLISEFVINIKENTNFFGNDNDYFKIFDPNLQNLQLLTQTVQDILEKILSNIGISLPQLQGSNQKSEYEIRLLKQKETMLKNKMRVNLGRFVSQIFSILQNDNDGFVVKPRIAGLTIDNPETALQIRNEAMDRGVITKEEYREMMEEDK